MTAAKTIVDWKEQYHSWMPKEVVSRRPSNTLQKRIQIPDPKHVPLRRKSVEMSYFKYVPCLKDIFKSAQQNCSETKVMFDFIFREVMDEIHVKLSNGSEEIPQLAIL